MRLRLVAIGFDMLDDEAIRRSITRKADLHVEDVVAATVILRNGGRTTSLSTVNLHEMSVAHPESKPLQTLEEAATIVVALFQRAREVADRR